MDNEAEKKNAEPQINVVIGNLLESAADKSDSVCFAVNTALKKIAKRYPNELLKTTCLYMQRNPKIPQEHVFAVLEPMEQVCLEHIINIDGDTVLLLISFCVDEMTKSPDNIPDVQMALSGILVALGKKHCIQVLEGVMKKLIVGNVPHYTIPHTLGSLSSANPFAVLPFLKVILGTMLPMLGLLKTDHMKQSFVFALGRFCEAINEYMSNIKSAPDPTIQKDFFCGEIGLAFDLIVLWLQSREVKLVESVLQAVGPLFSILSPEKAAEHTPKLLATLLVMCKRQKELCVAQCLACVLAVALPRDQRLLDPHLDSLLSTLTEMIAPVPDYVRPESVKSQAEVLRCFDLLGKFYCDATVDYFVVLMKNNNERDRIKALLVVTHLVNSSDSVIKGRIPEVVQSLRQMLSEPNLRVKLVLLKTIVAFAYHGHFYTPDCSIFIEFIIRLCCATPSAPHSRTSQDLSDIDWQETLRTCDNSLYLLTTSVLELEYIFWRLFHECLLNRDYSAACCTLLRCLTNLAARKNKEFQDSDKDSTKQLVDSQAVFARCLVLLGAPQRGEGPGNILGFFRQVWWTLAPNLEALWGHWVPLLSKKLQDLPRDSSEDVEMWEALLLEFLAATVGALGPQWAEALVLKLVGQLPLWPSGGAGKSREKGFALKCIATTLNATSNLKFVKDNFDVLLHSARLNNPEEASACAQAVGLCARVHMQVVIPKLNALREDLLKKPGGKFLNFAFMKDARHETETEKLRYSIVACYAEVVLQAPPEKMLLIIEHEVLNWVVQELQNARDFQIKNICIFALGRIAEAMHPGRNTLHIRMMGRDEVLSLVVGQLQLHNGPEYIELYPVILPVLTALVKLRNDLEPDQRVGILRVCFETIYNAAAIYCKINLNATNNISYGDLKLAPFVYNSFGPLITLTRTLLLQSLNPATLDDILSLLEPWLNKRKAEQRLPALENLQEVLSTYLSQIKFACEAPSKFGQTGLVLGRVLPRCTDPNVPVRGCALESARLVLCIAARYEGHMSDYNEEIARKIAALRTDLASNDPKVLFAMTSALAKVVGEYLPQFQQVSFVESLMDGLLDFEPSSSSGCSVMMHVFLKIKGPELHQHVGDVVGKLLGLMGAMTCTKTRASSVRSVLALAVHHPKTVVSVLLTNPLPYDSYVSDCWTTLAQDHTLALDIVEQFKRLFSTIPLYEEQQNAEKLRISTLQPLAAVCALREMFRNAQMQEISCAQLPELFTILLMIFSSYIGASPPICAPQPPSHNKKDNKYSIVPNREAYKLVPAKIALETLKLLLLCAKQDRIVEVFLQCMALESCTTLVPLVESMEYLAEGVFKHAPNIVSKLVACFNQYAGSHFEPQRITTHAFFVEVLKHKGNGQPALVETVIATLLNGQTDSSPMVRQLSLRGLGYVSSLDGDQCTRHCTFVFAALMQGIDDHEISPGETNVPLESLLSFSKMLHGVEERHLDAIQVSAAVRIRPFYEKEDTRLRAAAFRLFGDLARPFASGARADAFLEQVTGNFICLLLHLADEDSEVVKACKYTLRQISPVLEAPKVNLMIQDHLIEEANLHYTNFIPDLIKIMAEELLENFPLFVMNALSFLKSQWSVIRSSAALMVGLLYSSMPPHAPESGESVDIDTVCYRLMQLLQDNNPEVRAKAVQGLSYVFVT